MTDRPIVRKHLFEGEWVEGTYDVFLGEKIIGKVRKGTAPNGYWGCWFAGKQGFPTRREAVQSIVNTARTAQ